MKIVKLLGGLGNQMFQYALYLSLKETFPEEKILIDLSCFKGYPLHNGFELGKVFSLDCPVATWKEVMKVAYPYPHYRCWQIGKYLLPKRKTLCMERPDFAFDETVLTRTGNRYFDGYWQHDAYFSSIKGRIRDAFTFPRDEDVRNRDAIDRALSGNSVAIHIRRGDYMDHPLFHGICDLGYYENAIRCLSAETRADLFFVFSNDVEWCRKNLNPCLSNSRVVYVDWNTGARSFRDMQIMSCCKHNIIANSSFSWWGACLNPNPGKIVIAPEKWMNLENIHDPVPAEWIRIK